MNDRAGITYFSSISYIGIKKDILFSSQIYECEGEKFSQNLIESRQQVAILLVIFLLRYGSFFILLVVVVVVYTISSNVHSNTNFGLNNESWRNKKSVKTSNQYRNGLMIPIQLVSFQWHDVLVIFYLPM